MHLASSTPVVVRAPFWAELGPLLRLATPIALGNVGHALMGLTDTAVAGRLGPAVQGGVGLGNGLYFSVSALGLGVALGFDPLLSQAVGAGQGERARQLWWQGIWLVLGVSALLSIPIALTPWLLGPAGVDPEVASEATRYLLLRLLGLAPALLFFLSRAYLQALGRPSVLVWATILANLLNLAADIVLMHGGAALPWWLGPLRHIPSLGAAGGAIATVMCTALQLAMLLMVIRRAHRALPPAPVPRPEWGSIRKALAIGLPVGLQMAAEVGVFALAGVMAGGMGKEDLAAHQIALTYASLSFCLALGFGSAGSTRVGWAIGRGDLAAARRAGWMAFAAGSVGMSVAALAFVLFPMPLARLMTDRPEVMATAFQLFVVCAVFQLSDGVQGIGAGVLRGAGDTRMTMGANLVGHYLFGLPLALVLSRSLQWGVAGLWWGLCAGLWFVALVLLVRFSRLTARPLVPA